MAEANLHAIISIAGMPIKEDVVLDSLSVTENGSYTPSSGVDGFSEVTVDVQPILTDITLTENGTYKAKDYGAYGFNEVTTDINTGYTVDDIATANISGEIYGEADLISSYAFAGNSGLTSINFPNATSIRDRAFYRCSSLSDISIPNVTSIGTYGLSFCRMESLNLPNVTSLGNNAVNQCDHLREAMFPNATEVGTSVFSYNSSLAKVDLRNYQGSTNRTSEATLKDCFGSCQSLKYVAFQNLVNGFQQTNSLYSLFITNAVLKDTCYFIFDMETPPTLASITGAFYGVGNYGKMVICVPQSALTDWQNATNWASMNIQSIESLETELKGQFDWLDQKYWSTT